MTDLFSDKHVVAALFFTDLGHFLFKVKKDGGTVIKNLSSPTVTAAFSQIGFDSGWMASGVIRTGVGPKGKYVVYFHEATVIEIKITGVKYAKSLIIPIPATVFMIIGNKSYILALKENKFPTKAEGFHAPFANTFDDGKICWGKNSPPKPDPMNIEEAWNKFFASPFNSDLANGKSEKEPKDVNKFLKTLAGKKKYPVEDLVPIRSCGTVGQMIEKRIKDG